MLGKLLRQHPILGRGGIFVDVAPLHPPGLLPRLPRILESAAAVEDAVVVHDEQIPSLGAERGVGWGGGLNGGEEEEEETERLEKR